MSKRFLNKKAIQRHECLRKAFNLSVRKNVKKLVSSKHLS